MYVIIRFLENNNVEVLPKSWLIAKGDIAVNVCVQAWLPEKNLSQKAKRLLPPNHYEGSYHECLILGIFETYEKARKKLLKAEDTDNMDSTDMEQGRKRFKNPKYESEESESDASSALTECNIQFPEPPMEPQVTPKSSKVQTVNLSSTAKQFRKGVRSSPRLKTNLNTQTRNKLANILLNDTEEGSLSTQEMNETFQVPQRRADTNTITGTPEDQGRRDAQVAQTPELLNSAPALELSVSLPTKAQVQELYNVVVRVEQKLDILLSRDGSTSQQNDRISSLLPVKTIDDFNALSGEMANKEFCSAMETYLIKLGGSAPRHFIFNMMKQIMSDTMAVNFSLSGKGAGRRAGEKEKLDGSRVLKMVKDVCLKKFNTSNDKEVRIAVSDWLSQALPRLTRRNTVNTQSSTD